VAEGIRSPKRGLVGVFLISEASSQVMIRPAVCVVSYKHEVVLVVVVVVAIVVARYRTGFQLEYMHNERRGKGRVMP